MMQEARKGKKASVVNLNDDNTMTQEARERKESISCNTKNGDNVILRSMGKASAIYYRWDINIYTSMTDIQQQRRYP